MLMPEGRTPWKHHRSPHNTHQAQVTAGKVEALSPVEGTKHLDSYPSMALMGFSKQSLPSSAMLQNPRAEVLPEQLVGPGASKPAVWPSARSVESLREPWQAISPSVFWISCRACSGMQYVKGEA